MTPQMVPVTIGNATLVTASRAVVLPGISVMVRTEPWGGARLLSHVLGTHRDHLDARVRLTGATSEWHLSTCMLGVHC